MQFLSILSQLKQSVRHRICRSAGEHLALSTPSLIDAILDCIGSLVSLKLLEKSASGLV